MLFSSSKCRIHGRDRPDIRTISLFLKYSYNSPETRASTPSPITWLIFPNPQSPPGHKIESVVPDPSVLNTLWDFLIQEDHLSETASANERIIYDLLNNRIVVLIKPSACHDYTAAPFTEGFVLLGHDRWSKEYIKHWTRSMYNTH